MMGATRHSTRTGAIKPRQPVNSTLEVNTNKMVDSKDSQGNFLTGLKRLRQIVSLGALLLVLAHLIWPALAIDAVTITFVVIAILPWLAPLIKSLEFPGGLKVELHEMVQREVSKASAETLRRVAAFDQKMIEYWERESIRRHEDSEPKLRLLEETVEQLELDLTNAPEADKPHLGFALREMYLAYIKHARDHYASSEPYQKIRHRVMAGLARLEKL